MTPHVQHGASLEVGRSDGSTALVCTRALPVGSFTVYCKRSTPATPSCRSKPSRAFSTVGIYYSHPSAHPP
jgi:hypothetical protein